MADFYSSTWYSVPNGGAKYRLKLVFNVVSQDISANKTIYEVGLRIVKDRSYQGFYDYFADWAVVVDGGTVDGQTNAQNPTAPWTGWNEHALSSKRLEVTHDDDGEKQISITASWGRTGGGGALGYAPGPMSVASGTITLPTIPRATTPTVAPSPAPVGGVVTISMPRLVGTYTHDVTWASGTMSGTIGTGLATSEPWTVPDVMGEFPGLALAPIVITVVTKSGATVIGSKQVTLFAREPAAPPDLTPRDPDQTFDVRARVVTYEDDTWEARVEVPADEVALVDPASATATGSVGLSLLNATEFPDYSIVDIDIFDGFNWVFTQHRLVLSRLDGDDVDPTESTTFSGTEFVDYILGFAYAQKDYYWDGGTDHGAPTTPGAMLKTVLDDAQARGWGVRLDFNFDGSVTSLGEPWANTAVSRNLTKGQPISQMLTGLVADGYLEYTVEYHSNKAWLVLHNPGTGSDYSAVGAAPVVNLGLANLKRAPRRGSAEKRLTRVTVAGDDDIQVGREKAPFDADVFGQMEGWVSASGVASADEAGVIGDNALRDNSGPTNERTFEYDAKDAAPQFFPYSIFRPNDWVLRPGTTEPETDRVAQVTISKTTDGTDITVLTGDRILSGVASLAKRQDAATGGTIPGGSQLSPSPLDARIPSAPVIDTVTSTGYWNLDGAAKSQVDLSWAEITEAVNGAPITVDLYDVYWKPAVGGEWAWKTSTDQLSASMLDFEPLTDLVFRIRGRSVAGVFGEFSVDEDGEVTTLAPATDLDGPDLADLYTDGVGGIYAVWGGTLDGLPAPSRVAYVGAEISDDGGATYTTEGTTLSAAGLIVLNRSGAWGEYTVRLRAYDRLGNPGDASDPQTIEITDPHITPAVPAVVTGLDSTPGAGWDASGTSPIAWFDLTWDVPTLDTEGNAIDIVGYDIWGKKTSDAEVQFLTSSPVSSVRWRVGSGEEWSFQVSASSSFGGVSALSDPLVDVADATISAAPAPTAPTLSQYAGILRIQWAGGGMEPYIKYVYATISSDDVTYTRAGMPLQGAGEIIVPGLAPGDYYAKIVMVDEAGNLSTSAAAGPMTLDPITGVTIQTSAVANTGIKLTDVAMTVYDVSGNPTFILDATTGEVWIAPYDAVFDLGASGMTAEGTPTAVTGIAISSQNSSFNTFVHPSGLQIRNDQTALSWWEGDPTDGGIVNFVSPRARIDNRLRIGDYEMKKEAKTTGTRLVIRYVGA